MAKIPLPGRGQPLDLAYIYTLGEALNDMASLANASIYDKINGDDVASSKTRTVAVTVPIVANGAITAGSYQAFSVTGFGTFSSVPVATATPLLSSTLALSNDVTAVLTSVTTTRIDGVLRFNAQIDNPTQIAVNVIIIGIPA